MRSLRRQKRQERREYHQRHSPKTREEGGRSERRGSEEKGRRTTSPSPGKRRGSVESRDSSTSPPLTPPSPSLSKTLPRRTKSTSLAQSPVSVTTPRKASTGGGYAFGSSTVRFKKSSEDARGLGSCESLNNTSPHSNLTRTISANSVGKRTPRYVVFFTVHVLDFMRTILTNFSCRMHLSIIDFCQYHDIHIVLCLSLKPIGIMSLSSRFPSFSHKSSVTKAWLQFQEDIEAAMLRKPGGGSGLYKNLTDLMHHRMDQLDQVRVQHTEG